MAVPATEAIIFDCFGVLYTDTKQSLLDIVAADRRQELHDLFTGNNYGLFDKQSYLQRVAAIVGRRVDEVAGYIAREHALNAPLVELIRDRLRRRYKIGLLSNIGREWMDDFFSVHELHDLFDDVVLSGEEGIAKPNTAIFELAAARLSVPTNACLMIDDIEDNCAGAAFAGMEAIRFTSNPELLDKLAQREIV